MTTAVEKFSTIESELLHERFADFERGVLQDNIILCDAKSGVLLAFDGAMVIFSVDAFVGHHEGADLFASHALATGLFMLAALLFLFSCHFSLTTVVPRIRRGGQDRIFWEADIFRQPVEDYVNQMESIDNRVEHRDKLRHLHMLAGICRAKFRHFLLAMRFGQVGFLVLVLAELARIVD